MYEKMVLYGVLLDIYGTAVIKGLYCVDENGELIKNQLIFTLFVNCFLVLLGNVAQTAYLFLQKQDIVTIATSGYVVAISWLCSINFCYLFKHRRLLASLFADLNNDVFQPTNKQSIEVVKRSYKIYKFVKNTLVVICTTAVTASVITPLLRKNEAIEVRFAVKLWYPFDISVSPALEFVYVLNAFLNIYYTLMNIYIQIMVAAFTTFIGSQCDLLCSNMDAATDIKSIKDFIFHHRSIVDFANRTEAVISEVYMFIFAASNISICMTLFLLQVVERFSYEFFFLISYSFGITFQLFLPCWFSSEMKRKSEKLPSFVYSLPWHDAPNNLKKDVYLLLVSSQEYIILTVMNLFPLSVDTFIKLLKSSFSYYTVLSSMNEAGN